MNVYLLDDMSWEYQFADRSLNAATLEELELLVNLYGLKWNILDENLAKESVEIDKNNHTGFLVLQGFRFKGHQPSGIEKEGYGQGFGMEGNRQGPGI